MAYNESARAVTAIAGTAITKDRFVAIAADGQADHVASAQGDVDGISGEGQATVGEDFAMVVPDGGIATVEAGAAVAVGGLVASDNVGRAIPWVDAAGNVCMGRCVASPAANAGEIISIQFIAKKVGAGT